MVTWIHTLCYFFRGYLPYFCTGFLALNSNNATKKLLQDWSKSIPKAQQHGNQFTFQKAVIESGAKGKVLPLNYFPHGQLFFEDMPQEDRINVSIIHNNFIKGI